jgi:hypothetical protein
MQNKRDYAKQYLLNRAMRLALQIKYGKGVSFGRQGVLFRLGSKPYRFFLLDDIFHCTCAAFRIRRSLDSTFAFSPPVGVDCVIVLGL